MALWLLSSYSVPLLVLTVWWMQLQPHMVLGDRMIRFSFNDGISPTPFNECTVDDNRFIDPLFNITANLRTRRQLLDSIFEDGTVDPNDHENLYYHHRELYAASCKNNCEGYARGTCRATGCLGYRRRERERELSFFRKLMTSAKDQHQNHREEFTPCTIQVAALNAALDLLVMSNKISAPCKLFLARSKRKSECYDDIVYGEILSFTFYNMNVYRSRYRPVVGIIGTNIPNGYKICSNIPFNAEVVLNPCVHTVNFTMTGPNNLKYTRIDDNHPMLLYNTTVNAATYGGKYLSPGNYTFTARPDDFAYKEKKLDFTVIAC